MGEKSSNIMPFILTCDFLLTRNRMLRLSDDGAMTAYCSRGTSSE